MRKNCILILLVLCQAFVFPKDKKVIKITKYIEKGKGTEAKELLDELDGNKEYQSDINYWYVRTVYYRNITLASTNNTNELAEARKSFEKLVELDKTDPSKSFTQYIPQIKKDLYEGKNQMTKSKISSQSGNVNQANDGKTVTLTQIGQGKTKDAAKYNALRNAIEKAFGTFISSNTTLLNDELVKDEIVSVSTGNIQNFEILSETQMPDGSFSSVVKATVSIGKLTTFCEGKGIAVEFKGGLFAANIKLQELNKKNEEAVMKDLYILYNSIIRKGMYDFSILTEEPKQISGGPDQGKWDVKLNINSKANKNLNSIFQIITSTLRSISLNENEVQDYENKNISVFKLKWENEIYNFRSIVPIELVMKIVGIEIPRACSMFKIENGIMIYNFPYNEMKSFNFSLNLRTVRGRTYQPRTGVIFGKAIRLPGTSHDEYEMLLKYDKVYNPTWYTNPYNSPHDIIKITTSELFECTNEIHNILDINELSKIEKYKVFPIR